MRAHGGCEGVGKHHGGSGGARAVIARRTEGGCDSCTIQRCVDGPGIGVRETRCTIVHDGCDVRCQRDGHLALLAQTGVAASAAASADARHCRWGFRR